MLNLPFSKLRTSRHDWALLTTMLAFSLFCTALLAARTSFTNSTTFSFLAWNLFLAWIPFGISALANRLPMIASNTWLLGLALAAWLLFFPNSPYILTDLIHLKPRSDAPFWMDLLLLLSFAIHGLLLCMASLFEVHNLLNRKFRPLWSWVLVTIALLASAYGVFLGRYLRWNSWNIVTHPEALLRDVMDPILHPDQNKETWAMTLGFTSLMMFCYLFIHGFRAISALGSKQNIKV